MDFLFQIGIQVSKLESTEFGLKGAKKGLQSITNFTARIDKNQAQVKEVTAAEKPRQESVKGVPSIMNFTTKVEKNVTKVEEVAEKPREEQKKEEPRQQTNV